MRVLLIISVIILLNACKSDWDAPCRGVNYREINLESTNLDKWPYTLPDTLKFIRENGDTGYFLMDTAQVGVKMVAFPNNPDCPSDQDLYEYRRNVLTDTTNMISFYTDILLYEKEIRCAFATSIYEFSFSALSNTDSVAFSALEFHGKLYSNVFVRTGASGDSLYYSPNSGIIRYSGLGKVFTLLP